MGGFSFHEGERRVQRRADGVEAADWGAENAVSAEIPEVAAAFLREQVMVLAGHQDPAGAVWASVLVGRPGFLSADDARTVRIAALPRPGDPLEASLAAGERALGLLAIEPGTKRRMRVNGRGALEGGGLRVRTEQVYANCPKYISVRRPDDELDLTTSASGAPAPAAALTPADRELVAAADTFFVASVHDGTGADVSHRGGNPGFVTVHDATHLSWPDYRGNSMYMTLGNLELDPRVGLLFPDWATGDVLQLTGTATTDWDPERAATVPGAQRVVDATVERVLRLPGALGRGWRFEKASRASPPAAPTPAATHAA